MPNPSPDETNRRLLSFEPIRIQLSTGGIGRVVFSYGIPTQNDIRTLIRVLRLMKRKYVKRDVAHAD